MDHAAVLHLLVSADHRAQILVASMGGLRQRADRFVARDRLGIDAGATVRERLHALDDADVVEAFLAGEERAFQELVERCQARLLNFVVRTIGDRERGEDLVQEVFIRVYRHLHRFDRSKKFSTWIYTIASNLAKNELRNRSRNPLVFFQTLKKNWDDEDRPLQFEDSALRRAFAAEVEAHVIPSPSVFGYEATLAALQHGDAWLEAQLEYLRGNRDLVESSVGLPMAHVEATYLAWIDCSRLGASGYDYFLERGVALSPGSQFGAPAFVRLNFATQRARLAEALRRMGAAAAHPAARPAPR